MADETKMQAGDNPGDYTVDQVNAYLADQDADERRRVLEAEESGENRKGIVYGPHGYADDAPTTSPTGDTGTVGTDPVTGGPATTEHVVTPTEANDQAVAGEGPAAVTEFADALDRGYLGTSPGVALTGRADKGLSQANPDVMNGGEPREGDTGVIQAAPDRPVRGQSENQE